MPLHDAASDFFSLGVHFQCRLLLCSYGTYVQSHESAIGHMLNIQSSDHHIWTYDTLVGMGRAAPVTAVALPGYGGLHLLPGTNEVRERKKQITKLTDAYINKTAQKKMELAWEQCFLLLLSCKVFLKDLCFMPTLFCILGVLRSSIN